MNQVELVRRVRKLTRDLNSNIFVDSDIQDFINEGIERASQIILELKDMTILRGQLEEVKILPQNYHHLLALYGASRCFTQDERHYQASNLMNEYEFKLEELHNAILNGDIVLLDTDGKPIETSDRTDYVHDNYYLSKNSGVDMDNGIEGL